MQALHRFALCTAALLAGCAGAPLQAPAPGTHGAADTLWLDRLTWGASSADLAAVRTRGRNAWLEAQLTASTPARLPEAAKAQIEALPLNEPLLPLVQRMEVQRKAADALTDDVAKAEAQKNYQQALTKLARDASARQLLNALYSPNQVQEQLTWFWFNHFNVHQYKSNLRAMVGDYEQGLRERSLGRFRDLLGYTAHHPAMLRYLDNEQNAANRINENYARELLELHTLGVNGGYTQQDVQELAKILTGWTVDGLARQGAAPIVRPRARAQRQMAARNDGAARIGFAFQELLHEPGTKTVLGTTYAEAGLDEGERAIRALCRHPSTAAFVATKLVTHFVSDEPPAAAVDRITRVFRETDGDLRAISSALIELPDAWSDGARKFRTPQDWLVAVLRAFNAPEVSDALMPILRQLRHPLWSPQAPKGFGDGTQEWADPDSLLNRAELARTVGRRLRLQPVDARDLLDVIDRTSDDALEKFVADSSIPADERLALVLAGPAFQWR